LPKLTPRPRNARRVAGIAIRSLTVWSSVMITTTFGRGLWATAPVATSRRAATSAPAAAATFRRGATFTTDTLEGGELRRAG
jgi:hypothetical protein